MRKQEWSGHKNSMCKNYQGIKRVCVRESERERNLGWRERITFERICEGCGK